jgi:hypothetical protein
MIRVHLTPSEIAICNYVAKYRDHETSQHAEERIQHKKMDALQLLTNGTIAEYAASKYLNLHFDLNCEFRKFGADLVSSKGKTIDVKCTSKEGGNLNAVVWSANKPCDIFVLTEIRHSHVLIVGWIDRDEFLRDHNKRDVGNGPFYSVPQSQLKQFKERDDKEAL